MSGSISFDLGDRALEMLREKELLPAMQIRELRDLEHRADDTERDLMV